MRSRVHDMAAFMLLLVVALATAAYARAAPGDASNTYDASTKGPVPIPPAERDLHTVLAEPWLKVSEEGLALEGPAFDRAGNLLFLEIYGGRVFKVDADKRLTTLIAKNDIVPAGLAIHKDGRIFLAGVGNLKTGGSVIAFSPDGERRQTILPKEAGYLVDDLVFDHRGGFYFSDFKGSATQPDGGVYYASADHKTITPVLPHLAVANGVALSPDGKYLWVTEFSRNLLYRVQLVDATTVPPLGTAVAYQFTGPYPDSLRVDADGNVYAAMYEQGRVLIFNPHGMPIGQILVPGREKGHFLRTTSLAIKPGTNEVYIVASDGDAGQGAMIFRAPGFAQAHLLYSHQ